MTKLDFPDTPSTGQQYGSSGTVWRWDGTRWGSTAGAAGARGRVAYAQINASQGGITSAAVDIAGLSVTWTADPSRTYRTTILLHLESTVATDTLRGSIHDGAGVGKQYCYTYAGAVSKAQTQTVSVIESGISGSTTRKVQVYRQSGTGTLNCAASAVLPAFILVEDITYEAGSTPAADPNKPWNVAWGTLGTAAITANQTGYDTVLRDISGLYVTVPTPAFRKLRYTLTVAVGTPSATWVQFHIADAGNNGKQSLNLLANGANATTGTTFCYYNTGTTDPTVTAKVRGSAGVNGWQISANANMPTLLTIEDVGPVTPI